MNIIYSSLRNVHFYLQTIEYTSGVFWTLSIALSLLLLNILKVGSIFVLGQKWGEWLCSTELVWKSWCLFLSLRANQVVSIPHFHLKMKTGPFFWNIMVLDNRQHPDTGQAYYNVVSSESVKANFFGWPPLKVQFLYLNQLSQTQIAYGSNRWFLTFVFIIILWYWLHR